MSQEVTPAPPESVETRCATCREDSEHEVLKGKVVRGGLGVEGTFKCYECETIHSGLVTFPAPLDVAFIVSIGEEAEPHAVQLFDDDQVAIGDEFEIDDNLVEVTGIQLKDQERRVRRAKATDIQTLWGKNINFIRVGFALNKGDRTLAFESDFGPEDEIAVGDEFEYDEGDVVVERIITTEGKRFRGSFNVRDIKRVWLKRKGAPERRPPRSDAPRSQKEQRQESRKRPTGGRPAASGGPRSGPYRGPGGRPSSGGGGASRGGPRSGGPGRGGSGGGGGGGRGGGRGPSRGGPRSGGPGRGGSGGGGGGGGGRGGARGPSRGGSGGGRGQGGRGGGRSSRGSR